MAGWDQTGSFGDVGSMSGLPESGDMPGRFMSTGPSNRAASSSATPSAATSLSMRRLYVAQRIRGGLLGYSSSVGSPAKPQEQLAGAPEGSVILSLSLGGVGNLISAPRPKVTAAERQV